MASIIDPADVIQELSLNPLVFDYSVSSRQSLESRVTDAILQQEALILRRVGSSNYNSTTDPTKTCVRTGIMYLVCAAVLRQVVNILAYAPQNVIEEVAAPELIQASIDDYTERANDFLNPYYTSESEAPTFGFAIGTTGVAERQSTWRGVPTTEYEGKDEEVAEEEYLEDIDG